MSIFSPNNNLTNSNNIVLSNNYPHVEATRETLFGNIDPQNNKIIRYNFLEESLSKGSNNTTNIRITFTEKAIRNNKFDHFFGKFDPGFPTNDFYTFCNPQLSIVFNYNSSQYTRKTTNDSGYPQTISIQSVYDSIQNNQYGLNYTGSCVGCPGGIPPDPITGLCAPPEECIPDPVTPCPEPELVNLKNTIYGYAFYLDTIRSVNIPNIGTKLVRCAGGHRCSRTHFKPKLLLSNSTIINASNNISLDNLTSPTTVPQYNPVPGFTDTTGGERSNSFTFTVPDPSLLDNSCEVFLECLSPTICHNSVTMIFLVGQRSDNNEYVLIFADCVAPGTLNAKFLGSVPCNQDPPSLCEPVTQPTPTPTPPPDCSYLTKTQANITFSDVDIPFESMGDQDLIDQLELLIYNGPHTITFTSVDEFGISSDPYLIGVVAGSIQVLAYFNAIYDGLGNLNVSVALNILQVASPYPYTYGLDFLFNVSQDNLCFLGKTTGQITIGNGISGPSYTGDGNESVEIDLI